MCLYYFCMFVTLVFPVAMCSSPLNIGISSHVFFRVCPTRSCFPFSLIKIVFFASMDMPCFTRLSSTSAKQFTDDYMCFDVFHGKKRVRACHVVDFYVLWCAYLVFVCLKPSKKSQTTPLTFYQCCAFRILMYQFESF